MADLVLGPGVMVIAPEPRCPKHGAMREDFARDLWTCAGWDGEGCGYTVQNEDRETAEIDWAGPLVIRGVTRG